ncbi:MAG: TonB-dependent receptor plug domain-containing protein [Elusimicrobiales bacterium]
MRLPLIALLALLPAAALASPGGELDFFDFERASLDETLNVRTAVASRLDFPAREAPGIVTVITRAEIINAGARNLADALRLAPGLDLGVDVESTLGVGIRGNWAYEGKVLLVVDGQRYNEPFFGTAQIGRIPVEQIEKIEIIRGPGSSVYGGFAGLGVIKIDTRSAKALDGAEASAAYGRMQRGGAEASANFAYAKVYEDCEFSAQFHHSGADRSDRRYAAFDGTAYGMNGDSDLKSRGLNLHSRNPWFTARFIADLYRTEQRDGSSSSTFSGALARNFDAYFAELSRELRLADNLTLTPSFNYTYQEPFNGYDAADYPRDKSSHSSRLTLVAAYEAAGGTQLSGGAEYLVDKAILADNTPDLPLYDFKGGKRNVKYTNTALFLEGLTQSPLGLFSIGARYDKNQEFSQAFSPRLAWTKVFGSFHAKAIHSRSFRAPGIDNLAMNADLGPERVTVTELETGYKLTDYLFVSANVYDIRIKDPIVFYLGSPSPGNPDGQAYGNYGRTGTNGFELTARLKQAWGYADASYSRYAAAHNTVDFYSAGSGGELLAFARDKFTLNSSFRLAGDFSVNPSAVYLAGRYGYRSAEDVSRFDDVLLANVNFSLKNLAGGRLELGLGVYDIFSSGYAYLQPYDGGHAQLPAQSREARLRLACKF